MRTVPWRLEARYEVSAKRAMEMMNKLGSKLLGTDEQDLHLSDDLGDEDLPFS